MFKRMILIAVIGVLAYSCGQAPQVAEEAAETMMIAELVSNPMEFEGQEVQFEGFVGHICRHSGDKMRLVQADDNAYSVLVMLEGFKDQFSPEFEGKSLKVKGILKTRVRNMDALEEEHDHEHEGEEGHECTSTAEAIAKLKEKGIEPDVVVYIEMTAYEVIEMEAADEVAEETEEEETEAGEEVAVLAEKKACC